MLQCGVQTLSFIASASVQSISCVLFGTFYYLWVKICWKGEMGRDCEVLKCLKNLSTFYCQEFYLAFSSCCCVRQKNLNKKLQDWALPTHPQSQFAQNWKMSRAITIGRHNQMMLWFNQASPTHHQSRIPCYLWLSFLPSVVTIISAGCDYPLVGLTPVHSHSIMFVSLNNLFSRCVVKNHLHFHHKCISVKTGIFG